MVSGAKGPFSKRQFLTVDVIHVSTSWRPAPDKPEAETAASSTRPEGATDLDLDHAAEARVHTQTFGLVAALDLGRVTQGDQSNVAIGANAVGLLRHQRHSTRERNRQHKGMQHVERKQRGLVRHAIPTCIAPAKVTNGFASRSRGARLANSAIRH